MGMDTDGSESIYAEERNGLRLEKLAQRVTIISILLPVLIGIILVISYLDIKSRVSTLQDTGESAVQSLSKNLESRFSSLSVKASSAIFCSVISSPVPMNSIVFPFLSFITFACP